MRTGLNGAVSIEEIHRFVQADRPLFLQQWQRIALAPAPAGAEAERAALIAGFARDAGADHVEIDRVGNVIATVEGSGDRDVTFLATMDDLDSVAAHRRATDRIELTGERLVGPCSQTTSSDATGLGLVRFVEQSQRRFRRLTVAFVLGEETGLTGVRALCEDRADRLGWVIDLMGGVGTISWNAIGFDGINVEFRAEPKHSLYGGVSEVSDAIARFVTAVHADVPPSVGPEPTGPLEEITGPVTIRRINRIAAGEVFNHSPQVGTVGVDVRSTDPAILRELGSATRAGRSRSRGRGRQCHVPRRRPAAGGTASRRGRASAGAGGGTGGARGGRRIGAAAMEQLEHQRRVRVRAGRHRARRPGTRRRPRYRGRVDGRRRGADRVRRGLPVAGTDRRVTCRV
jgi:hypothetical protein